MSGYFGPEVWSMPLAHYFPTYKMEIGDITLKELWIPIILFAFFVAHLPACIVNVAKARRAQNLPLLPLLKEWTPLVVFVSCTMAWLGSPYSHLLEDNHLVLYCLTMSLVFGRMTTKIILAHLTHQPFPYWTVMLVPMVGGALLVNHPYFCDLRVVVPPCVLCVCRRCVWQMGAPCHHQNLRFPGHQLLDDPKEERRPERTSKWGHAQRQRPPRLRMHDVARMILHDTFYSYRYSGVVR
jgi:hypothetical protein